MAISLLLISGAHLSLLVNANPLFSNRVTDGLQALYTFEEGQSSVLNRLAYDSTGNDLLGPIELRQPLQPVSSTWSEDSVGLQFPGKRTGAPWVKSQRNASALVGQWGDGFTIELFVHGKVGSTLQWVLGFGGNYTAMNDIDFCVSLTELNRLGGIRLLWNPIQYTYLNEYRNTATSCDGLSSIADPAISVQHLVFSYNPRFLSDLMVVQLFSHSLTANSNTTFRGLFVPLTPSLLEPSGPLVLGRQFANSAFDGRILLLALYNRTLSKQEAQLNYNSWLPNSKPYPRRESVVVVQDTLTLIQLDGYDYDNIHAPSTIQRQLLSFNITSKPSRGTLYYRNASAAGTSGEYVMLNASMIPYTIGRGILCVCCLLYTSDAADE